MGLGDFWNLLAPGEKPDELMPNWKGLSDIQSDAVAGNLGSLSSIKELAGGVNQFNYDQQSAMLEKSIPGYRQLQAQIGKNLMSGLKGELSKETQAMVRRSTAEGALRGGYQGSQVADWASAENLGKTTEQLQNESLSSFDRWTTMSKANTMPEMFNLSSMFLSPIQRASFEDQRSGLNFQAETRNAAIRAAPDPFMRTLASALGGTTDDVRNLAGTILGNNTGQMSAATGGGGGGGGGM